MAAQAGCALDRAQCNAAVGRGTLEGVRVLLVKPLTFMNVSGEAVGGLAKFYRVPPSRVIACYDDMDTAVSKIRLRAGGGHGGHNGVRSLIQHFGGTKDFVRVRVGTFVFCWQWGRPRRLWPGCPSGRRKQPWPRPGGPGRGGMGWEMGWDGMDVGRYLSPTHATPLLLNHPFSSFILHRCWPPARPHPRRRIRAPRLWAGRARGRGAGGGGRGRRGARGAGAGPGAGAVRCAAARWAGLKDTGAGEGLWLLTLSRVRRRGVRAGCWSVGRCGCSQSSFFTITLSLFPPPQTPPRTPIPRTAPRAPPCLFRLPPSPAPPHTAVRPP